MVWGAQGDTYTKLVKSVKTVTQSTRDWSKGLQQMENDLCNKIYENTAPKTLGGDSTWTSDSTKFS